LKKIFMSNEKYRQVENCCETKQIILLLLD